MSLQPVTYNIHGILTVESEVSLPELSVFRAESAVSDPDIRVVVGDIQSPYRSETARTVIYHERTGRHGFGIRLELDRRTCIVATPFLARSPHVLYTNAVEPVLRWAFVERGYALVHGACLAADNHAFLITARTDTGKTTTVLKTLDANPQYAFLSDDLTLLREDGTVLPYAKPLTISRHTLHAVHTPLLTRSERAALCCQSRLHSKSGRSFGLMLTRFNLPMATLNAFVQRVIPPPKYPIQRLVPHARLATSACLSGIMVIERGETREIALDHHEATSLLLANCEDSYGFPPYDDIKEHLYRTRSIDLRDEEHRIVSSALIGRPAVVIRSETRNWFQSIPAFVGRTLRPRTRLEAQSALALEPVGD